MMSTPKIIKTDPATYTDPIWDAAAKIGKKVGLFYWDKTVREYCTAEELALHKAQFAQAKVSAQNFDPAPIVTKADEEVAWVEAGLETKPDEV